MGEDAANRLFSGSRFDAEIEALVERAQALAAECSEVRRRTACLCEKTHVVMERHYIGMRQRNWMYRRPG
jgi:hypothetical protein